MYVGGHLPNEDPFTRTNFKTYPMNTKISIQLDSNGLFQSARIPSNLPIKWKNIVKGWINQFQINAGKIMELGMPSAFKSEEVRYCREYKSI